MLELNKLRGQAAAVHTKSISDSSKQSNNTSKNVKQIRQAVHSKLVYHYQGIMQATMPKVLLEWAHCPYLSVGDWWTNYCKYPRQKSFAITKLI